MRVRHKTKQREVEYQVIDEGTAYWIGHPVDRLMTWEREAVALPKAEYEPAPEMRWVRIYGSLEDRAFGITTESYRLVPVQIPGYDHPLYCVEKNIAGGAGC